MAEHLVIKKGPFGLLSRKYPHYHAYELVSIPDAPMDIANLFARKLAGISFSIIYDFKEMKIYAVTLGVEPLVFKRVIDGIPGLQFREVEPLDFEISNVWGYTCMPLLKEEKIRHKHMDHEERKEHDEPKYFQHIFSDLFSSLRMHDCKLMVSFYASGLNALDRERLHVEGAMNPTLLQRLADPLQTDVMDSDEKHIAAEVLAMINNALSSNDSVFKVSMTGWGEDSGELYRHVASKMAGEEDGHIGDLHEINYGIPQKGGDPMSGEFASRLIHFAPETAEEENVVKLVPLSSAALNSGLDFGTEMIKGVAAGKGIHLDLKALNRHTAVTGQQGTGKTVTAMTIASHALKEGSVPIVITPTKEWSALGREDKDLLVIDVAEVPLNLVRCPEDVPIDVFYQNLSLYMSNVMGAGPFTGPLRRVMLKAFRELYTKSREPLMSDVYKAVEESAYEVYGYNTRWGMKLDKFGQNIMSALEYLKEIMEGQNFNLNGLRIEECFRRGAVFDLSSISSLLRPLMYSFILTQIFSYALSKYDEKGEDELRLLFVLEEAQMIFKKQKTGDASEEVAKELEAELVGFRKHGIGLMFMTHYSDQLSEGIWRHSQNHIILKQDSIGAKLAITQLAYDSFNKALVSSATSKISKLKRGDACCLLTDSERKTIGPFFMRVKPNLLEPLPQKDVDLRMRKFFRKQPPIAPIVPAQPVSRPKGKQEILFTMPADKILFTAIGNREANKASEFIKLEGVKHRYVKALKNLLRQKLIAVASRKGKAKIYTLTGKGKEIFAGQKPGKRGKGRPVGVESEKHHRQIASFVDSMKGWKPSDNNVTIVESGKEKNCKLDAVLTKGNEAVIYEYETGSSNLLTNLLKMMTKAELLKKKGFKTKCIWEAANQKIKKKNFQIVQDYFIHGNKKGQLFIGTTQERIKNKLTVM